LNIRILTFFRISDLDIRIVSGGSCDLRTCDREGTLVQKVHSFQM
jgi:hypothetical protein